ncbi:transmembrane protein 272-like [Sebastes fasciatus]|uniref:transmembrane protein 272-like n=1 Tax=Sebastes fasciatus TaxID=394691 RepID=UPI003D9F7012
MSNGGLLGSIPDPLKPSKPVLGWSLFLFCAMNIAHIAIGAIYLDKCTRQPKIPIYLIVLGVFGLVQSILFCLCILKTPDDDTSNPIIRLFTAMNSLIACFLFCWFITGNVWIFSIYQPNYNKNTTNVDPYCNKTLYLFALWTTIFFYILLAEFLVYLILLVWHTPRNLGNDIERPTNQ